MTLDVEGKPEENCHNHILENYDFGSMPDEKFHRLMNMNDLSYSALFADKVFENTVWNGYEDKEILNVRSISSSEGNYSMVPEIFIQSKDELLNGVSPKPVIDNESEQEMNSVPCTMVNETDHLTCVNNGNCISLNSVTDNIKSTKCQLQPSSQTRDLDTPKGPLIHDEIINPQDSDFSRSKIVIEAVENCASQENNMYQKCIDSFQDEMDQDHIWCMLTDVLSYTVEENPPSCSYFKPIHTPLVYNTSLFHPQHSNIPCTSQDEISQRTDETHCKVDDNQDYINDRYSEVVSTTTAGFNPSVDICATYLWSDPGSTNLNSDTSWFDKGSFSFSRYGATVGRLEDGSDIRVYTLLDTGATKPILHKRFYERTPFMHTYPKYKITPRSIKIADNNLINVTECIKFPVSFAGHHFEFIAFLVDIIDDFDFVIGSKSMFELEADMKYSNLTFEFAKRSIKLIPTRSYTCPPHQCKSIKMKLIDCPPDFHSGTVVAKMITSREDKLPQTVRLNIVNGYTSLSLCNETDKPLHITRGRNLGCVDMRSAGYFFQTRAQLADLLGGHARFLTDEETIEYLYLSLGIDNSKQNTDKPNDDNDNSTNTESATHVNLPNEGKLKTKTYSQDITDPYPWLDPTDPRRNMTDEEIIHKYVDLSDSCLNKKDKIKLLKVLCKYKKAFSLRDEIGECPYMEVELELNDTKPFFIKPYPIREEDKAVIDKEMRRGVLLGILKKGLSSYSSPVMLIPRKITQVPRIVTDFRVLNSRIVKICSYSVPLLKDILMALGMSGVEVMSLLDLKDAYHSLRLSLNSKKYCAITPYYGSATYIYQRLGMGLSLSPQVWQNFLNAILGEVIDRGDEDPELLPYRESDEKVVYDRPQTKHHLAYMDDCLVHSKKKDHLYHIVALLKALIKHGLKISPKKCVLFRTSLTYMGHTLMVKDKVPYITPLKSRVDAITKMNPPTNVKECRQFCGMVNYLSMFLESLQMILVPIYNLTRKKVKFQWEREQQEAFQKIKTLLIKPPILMIPNGTDPFTMYSDTSKKGCGASLWQMQGDQNKLVGYHSKRLPDAVSRYSISELELTGLASNISGFKHLLSKTEFTVYVDHSALCHILRAKRQAPTLRLRKLIEILSDYSFVVKYHKGSEMHIADFLSRNVDNDTDDPHEVIPITFVANDLFLHITDQNTSIRPELKEFFTMCEEHVCDKCLVITRKMTSDQNVKVPDIKYSLKKPEHSKQTIIDVTIKNDPPAPPVQDDPPIQPEIPIVKPKRKYTKKSKSKDTPTTKPNKVPQDQIVDPIAVEDIAEIPSEPIQVDKVEPSVHDFVVPPVHTKTIPPIVPPTIPQNNLPGVPLEPTYQSANKPPLQAGKSAFEGLSKFLNPMSIDVTFRGKLPVFDKGKEINDHLPNMTINDDLKDTKKRPLLDHIIDHNVLRAHIPKQVEIDKFLDVLKKKVIHDYTLPLSAKQLRAEYKNSPFFKDIHNYISKGTCCFKGNALRLFKVECENYMIFEGLLFQIKPAKHKSLPPNLVLCIPESYIPHIIYLYHDNILGGHQGVDRMYWTIRENFYFPNMLPCIHKYVLCCQTCQSRRDKDPITGVHYARIPVNFRPLSRMSMDVKHMMPSKFGYNHILLCTCEISGYVIGIPIQDCTSITIFEAIFFKICCIFGKPKTLIFDEGAGFTSKLMKELLSYLRIENFVISSYNHGSNKTERYIRTINDMICKYLTGTGDLWPLYV